jgi:putative CocE/NonD family hydrolase
MSFASRAMARIGRLGPALSTDVVVERDIETKMPDGAILLSDRWFAPSTVASDPVLLLRSPYGRRQFGVFGRLFSERGYQVVIQSCRGTFGSGGSEFDPFHHERADGLATLQWISEQPWFTGSVGTFGPSYLGLVQWAVAADPPPFLKAMVLQVTTARVRDIVYPGGSFALETGATWVQQLHVQERGTRAVVLAMLLGRRRLGRAYTTLPLNEADTGVLGTRFGFYQDWLTHESPGDPWWDDLDWSREVGRTPPASMLAGWYDLFLPGQLEDFRRLTDAGREARLTVGPWTHASPRGGAEGLRDALDWLGTQLRGQPPRRRSKVRVFVGGSKRWVDLDGWPPPHGVQRWNLQPGGGLATGRASGPAALVPDRYRFDPADPAPGVGGPSLDVFRAGRRNQRRRESRADVLTYTSSPLGSDLTIAGPVNAEIWVRCSISCHDVFVRLCDVNGSGRSYNICDGIMRLSPDNTDPQPDGTIRVRIALWPTAFTFERGHRIRVQVSAAAHPLYARNPGSGEPLATASTLTPGVHEIFHDDGHPSAVELPVSTI